MAPAGRPRVAAAHAESGDGLQRAGGLGEVLPLLRRRAPLPADGEGRYVITPEQVVEAVDENTIGVVAILGTTYTGELEPVAEICAALDRLAAKPASEGGVDVPVHVDAASGGFVVPFLHPDLVWDFRLPRVVSINVSGHKYGLTYPASGSWCGAAASTCPRTWSFGSTTSAATCRPSR
ncbi:hypothetical protein I552_8847 [Mycobacterium xenopi 3993]|nr:hypothetical protein I552_8847 [Mycobacterium xenopi 3993]